MKKLLVFLACVLVAPHCFGADLKANTLSKSVQVAANSATGVDFGVVESRDLIIQNADPNTAVFIDLDSSSTTDCRFNTEGCFLLDFASTMTFRNYITDGISVVSDSGNAASWINIIATY